MMHICWHSLILMLNGWVDAVILFVVGSSFAFAFGIWCHDIKCDIRRVDGRIVTENESHSGKQKFVFVEVSWHEMLSLSLHLSRMCICGTNSERIITLWVPDRCTCSRIVYNTWIQWFQWNHVMQPCSSVSTSSSQTNSQPVNSQSCILEKWWLLWRVWKFCKT